MAVFRQVVDDFFVQSSFERTGGVGTPFSALTNAGKVEQTGVELGSTLQLGKRFEFALAYTFSDYTFDTFVNLGTDFSGKEVPGVPEHTVFAELSYRHPGGFFATVEEQFVDSFFVDNANANENSSYLLTNLRFGYKELKVGGLGISPTLGISNLFDEDYTSQTDVNAFGGRFFQPAAGINVFAGVSVVF